MNRSLRLNRDTLKPISSGAISSSPRSASFRDRICDLTPIGPLSQKLSQILSEQLSPAGQILGDRRVALTGGLGLAEESANSPHGVDLIRREASIDNTSQSLPYASNAVFNSTVVGSPLVRCQDLPELRKTPARRIARKTCGLIGRRRFGDLFHCLGQTGILSPRIIGKRQGRRISTYRLRRDFPRRRETLLCLRAPTRVRPGRAGPPPPPGPVGAVKRASSPRRFSSGRMPPEST